MRLFMIELTVANLAESLTWYRDRFGLPLLLHDEAGHFALLEAAPAKLALKQGLPRPDSAKLIFEVADLDARLATLADVGVFPISSIEINPEGYRQAFVADPDGFRLGLFEWLKR